MRSTFEVDYEALCTFQVARCAPPDYMALEWRRFFRGLTSLEALICQLWRRFVLSTLPLAGKERRQRSSSSRPMRGIVH